MINFQPNPIAFTIFGIDIMWYGILIGTGFGLAIWLSYKRAPKFGIPSERVLDLSIWLIPFSIIGARLYYVIFEWELYAGDFAKIIDVRLGGLAIHGGIIAGLIVGVLVAKKYKFSILDLMDVIFPTVALAQAIGRWGNFFNSEAHGGPTDLPWGIVIDGVAVHPTFLYESLWCLGIFIFLMIYEKRRIFPGQLALLYGMLYSFERFFVEGLRTDSLMIGNIRQAQLLSIVALIACAVAYYIMLKKHKAMSTNEQNITSTDEVLIDDINGEENTIEPTDENLTKAIDKNNANPICDNDAEAKNEK